MLAGTPTSITQEIIIDDVSLLFVIYELDRTTGNPMPSAQFTGFLKYPASRNGLSSGSSGSMSTPSSARPFSLSPAPTANASSISNNAANRGFSPSSSTATALNSSSGGFTSVANSAYSHHPHHQPGSLLQHPSAAMMVGNSGVNGAVNPSGLNAYSLPVHPHHTRHSSQTLAHALTPVRYPMTTSLPS